MSPSVALGCRHQQAEPVMLQTGEHVACVCIACFAPLSVGYIDAQRKRAERVAFCEHEDTVDLTAFGELPGTHVTCIHCGAWL